MIKWVRGLFRTAKHAKQADPFDAAYPDPFAGVEDSDKPFEASMRRDRWVQIVSDDTAELRPVLAFPVTRVVASRQYLADRIRRIYDDLELEMMQYLDSMGWSPLGEA